MTFFDIFSGEREKEKEKIKVFVDYREKNSLVASELINFRCELEFKQLPVADYIVNGIAIERKTVQDLKASIIDKRMRDQLKELKLAENAVLIIEGFDKNFYSGRIHENALRGFIVSLALEHRMPLIYTLDEKDTALYIMRLGNEKSFRESALRAGRKIESNAERVQFILEGFPGVGPATAKKLLAEFKTIKRTINASESEIKNIMGKKSEQFTRLIQEEYSLMKE